MTETQTRANGSRYFWTNHEDRILRESYPTGGMAASEPLLPRRPQGAIYQHAAKLGLCSPITHDFRRRRWHGNEHIDAAIRRTYQAAPEANAVRDLAIRVARPRWWVTIRARRLGLVVPRFREPPWAEPEVELLRGHAHKCPEVIARIFKARGFKRSATAIEVKRKRLQCDTADPNHCTATACALLMGVDRSTVTRWIENGGLKARRRGTARTPAQGGDHHWIRYRDLRRFIAENAAAVDLRKVDKFWFIDLLAGRYS